MLGSLKPAWAWPKASRYWRPAHLKKDYIQVERKLKKRPGICAPTLSGEGDTCRRGAGLGTAQLWPGRNARDQHGRKQRSRGRRLRGARRAGSRGQRWRSSWWASQGRKTELFLWNKNVRDPILKYHYRSQKLRSAKDLAGLQAARLLQPLPGCHRGGGSWRLRGEWASGTVPSATLTPDTQGRRDRDTRAEPPAREKDVQLGTRAFRSPGRERPSRGFSGAAVLPGCLLKAWKGRLKLADRATEVRPEFKSSSLWSAVWHWPSVVKSQLTNVDWGKVNVSGRMAPSGGWHRRGTTAWWALRDTEHGDSCRTWAQGLQGRRRTGTADGLL